jgi:Tfp pilus assembly protein PilX
MNRSFRNRRGVTSVIAMLFLVLIGTLALGFYSSVTTATALARNDRRTAKALMAAESGIQFMRNRLANVTIPPTTTSANLLNELGSDLESDPVIAGNLNGAVIQRAGNVITIPFICTDVAENSGFTVTLTDIGGVGEVVCTVKGRSGKVGNVSTKGVRLDFSRHEIPSTIFDSAVAAKGKIAMTKGAITGIPGVSSDAIIKIMSAAESGQTAIYMTGGEIGSINGGELAILADHDTNSDGVADTGLAILRGTVHGVSNPTTISNNVRVLPTPEFPTVDTTVFTAYATSTYNGATSGMLKNVRIPAGTNPNFDGNVTIQGILYIESPNTVTFRGNSNMQGFIVFEDAGSSAVNKIDARGNFTYGNLPADAEFDNLRAITGISMLAPKASLVMSGSVDSQIRGNLILGSFYNGGSADVQIEKGSIVTFDASSTANSATFSGKTVKFASTGLANPPSMGVTYSSRFLPAKGSYLELN